MIMADERSSYTGNRDSSSEQSRSALGQNARSDYERTGTPNAFGADTAGSSAFGERAERGAFEAGTDLGTSTGFGGSVNDDGTRAGSFDRKFTGERLGTSGRVERALSSGRGRIADQLQRVGERIEERARHMEDAGGMQRRAGHAVQRASDALDSGADYIRSHEVNEMREDLEDAIRGRPLLSVGVALGAGFLLARLMRD
jgi:ElaB/YqjD/DUF883 family membrane-anchored ribosome-binding protein